MPNHGRINISLVDLRREFPSISFARFQEIVTELLPVIETAEDLECLRSILRSEDLRAYDEAKKQESELRARFESLSASQMHRKLEINLDLDKNLAEHIKAILIYGLVAPASKEIFAGRKDLPIEHVRDDVRNKLFVVYSEFLFRAAVRYLENQGVVLTRRKKGATTLSLNVKKSEAKTPEGREIIASVINFMRTYMK